MEAATTAYRQRKAATLQLATSVLPGANYNRHRVLDDGRVVMAKTPAQPIAKTGPTWDQLLLLKFTGEDGQGIAGIAHWAAHPVTQCTSRVTADYPGELRRRLSEQCNMPFLYLQGACGNLNPDALLVEREEMRRFVARIMETIGEVRWGMPLDVPALHFSSTTVSLPYAPLPERRELRAFYDEMSALAATGVAYEATIASMGNVLNVEPGQTPDPAMLRYMAGCLREWSGMVLAQMESTPPSSCPLALSVLRLGSLVCCGIAAEAFSETALALQAACPRDTLMLIGYAAPLVGYLPTDDALREGGYEVNAAYRFYAHPAPFAPGAEALVRAALLSMITQS